MPFRSLLLAAGLSALLAGCGSEDDVLIPQSDADRLSALVAEAGSDAAAGECDSARRSVREAEQQLDGLPRRTNRRLKANLRDWLEHLDGRIAEECRAEPEETPEPTATPEETETPEPTATPEETETPDPTPTPEPEPTVEPDPGGGEDTPEDPQGNGLGPPEEPPGTGGVPPGEDG